MNKSWHHPIDVPQMSGTVRFCSNTYLSHRCPNLPNMYIYMCVCAKIGYLKIWWTVIISPFKRADQEYTPISDKPISIVHWLNPQFLIAESQKSHCRLQSYIHPIYCQDIGYTPVDTSIIYPTCTSNSYGAKDFLRGYFPKKNFLRRYDWIHIGNSQLARQIFPAFSYVDGFILYLYLYLFLLHIYIYIYIHVCLAISVFFCYIQVEAIVIYPSG